MKPTPQISSDQRRFPLTDHAFQPTLEARTNAAPDLRSTKPLSFYKLSSDFLNKETNRVSVAELFGFAAISSITAWPIVSALIAVVRMARNY